jgi:major membrane immunogen (membrane-anchored lipoprotein)
MVMKMWTTRVAPLLVCLTLISIAGISLSGCSDNTSELKDGYYTAQVSEADHGWTEFITICVSNDRIVTVEYEAKTAAGFIKSWDMDYMRTMNAVDGTYPNEYVRIYSQEFLEKQNPDIDAISGATHSYGSFKLLAAAVIAKAKAGDHSVAIVDIPPPEEAG